MMGPKKLSAIRAQLRRAFRANGHDPIRRLEECMGSASTQRPVTHGASEIMRSLRRVLEQPGKSKKRKQRAAKKD